MRKLTSRWVPKSISDGQMATRESVCSALLKRFRSKDVFLLRLVTIDATIDEAVAGDIFDGVFLCCLFSHETSWMRSGT